MQGAIAQGPGLQPVAARVGEALADEERSACTGEGARRSICLYTPSVDPSGMGEHMLDLAAEFVSSADVSVMCWATAPGQRVLARAASLGAVTLPLPRPRDPAFAATIETFLRAHPADVFHIHVGTGRENWDGARAARRSGVPVVIQTQHQPWLQRHPRKRPPFFRSIAPVDRLIVVSDAQRLTYERIGVPGDLLSTVPNGIRPRGAGPGRREARRALGLDADQPVLMTVGRLAVQKGQRYLLDAVPDLATRFPALAVVVIGQGHLRDRLMRQAAALGVERHVHLVGHRTDARQLLDAADVFVLPSRQEGMPLAALEAMDVGLPVVATRVIGTAEVVVDGQTGVLVPPEDAAALGAALAGLLGDPDLRARYGEAGRRRYLQRFTAERMAADTDAVYEKALQGATATSRLA